MRLTFTFQIFFASIFLLPNIASASFGDCTKREYLGQFGYPEDREVIVETLCVEEFNIEFSAPEGARRIRAIRDVNAEWVLTPGNFEAVEQGARDAIAEFPSLGDYAIDDVTILILDDNGGSLSDPGPDNNLGATWGYRNPDGTRSGECLITIFAAGLGRTPESVISQPKALEYAVAHELFHCVQAATLSNAIVLTSNGRGLWWGEGSAELFAARAVNGVGDIFGRAPAFSEAVNSHTALYDMNYQAALFFWWYNDEIGISNLMSFLGNMATDNSVAAHQSAMRAALTDEQWLDFAEAYADRSIKHPQGSELSFSSEEGEVVLIESNSRQTIPLHPFAIEQGWLEYQCEEWDVTYTPTDANIAMRLETGDTWQNPPDAINTEGAPTRKYRMAAFNTTGRETRYQIDPERTATCEPCAGSKKLDACLVGTWKMSGGGAIEWMKSQGIKITRSDPGPRIVSFKDDGIYATEPFGMSLTVEDRDMRGDAVGNMTVAIGRWSIVEGKLATCQSSGQMTGQVTVTTPKHSGTFGVSQAAAGEIMQGYSCSETQLTTTLPFAGMAPMVTQYSRISEAE